MIFTQRQGRFRAYMQQLVVWHMYHVVKLPRWRHPLVGYVLSAFLVGLGLFVGLIETQLLLPVAFPGMLLTLIVLIIALLWGVGPAVFAIVSGLLVLDYLYVPPFGVFGGYEVSGVLQLLTFALSGIIIALLASQHESARLRALMAEGKARTEFRANELAMQEAKRDTEEFLSLVCHELLTPLTIIKGSIQLAEQKVKRIVHSAETTTEVTRQLAPIPTLMERAKSQICLQDRLIHDLLDVSRMQSNTLKLSLNPCDLAWIVKEAIENQRQAAPSRTIQLDLSAEDKVPVQADSDRIAQVVTNYLTNALKYSTPDRPVEVRLEVEGTIARVTVSDQGSGLCPAEQENIWERFYRVRGITEQSGSDVSSGGLGIGLYICRTIIEQHHGEVGVRSSPGKGSNFWFTLPLAEQNGR